MPWQNIEGHDEVVAAFQQVIQRGRLGHAYLLVGPRGIGKRLFARTLAQTLLCEGRLETDFEPCGHCAPCAQVLADSHPDLIQLGRSADENELPIETIRRVIHDLGFKPDRGRHKIAIVDDADDLNLMSANCFLKCLEEPPPKSLLLLIGSSADLQLATIRSRCQVIRFRPLSNELVARVLLRTGLVADSAHAQRLATMSGGSLERARGLADPELWNFRSRLAAALADPHVDSVQLAESMNAIVDAAGKETIEKRTCAKLLLGMAADFLHDSLRTSVGARRNSIDPSTQQACDRLASHRSPEEICHRVERCIEADNQIDRMGSVPLAIEAWADEMGRGERREDRGERIEERGRGEDRG